MKKYVALCLALCLALTGCAGEAEPFDPASTAQAINASGAFSEELEEMDLGVYARWCGLDEATLTDGEVWASSGESAQELAVLVFTDEAAAQEGEQALRGHLDAQYDVNKDYRPKDRPRLEKAVLERRENTVLLLVADDYAAAQKAIG